MSWSGSFTNESFVGPGAYQGKNGVRCFIDMESTPGPVTVNAPADPEDNASFIIEWNNPAREALTFASADIFEDPSAVGHVTLGALVLTFRHGIVGFTFVDGEWELFNWNLFGVHMMVSFAVAWQGRSTNGICVLLGDHKGIEVERTAVGFYTIRLEPGTLASRTLVSQAPLATSLPMETSPELRVEDVGMAVADEILINSGLRNKNGQFSDNDLIQDPANFLAIIGQQFP
jgi:hypothetical protein